jgi:hypothetical protein
VGEGLRIATEGQRDGEIEGQRDREGGRRRADSFALSLCLSFPLSLHHCSVIEFVVLNAYHPAAVAIFFAISNKPKSV